MKSESARRLSSADDHLRWLYEPSVSGGRIKRIGLHNFDPPPQKQLSGSNDSLIQFNFKFE